eukprot:12340816-Alexandrium_andersonii.AAC.1
MDTREAMLSCLQAGLREAIAGVSEEGQLSLVVSSRDEGGFEKFTLKDVDENYEVLAALVGSFDGP